MAHDRRSWTGAILAGGAARRFGGQDKSALAIGGQTILERQVDALREVAGSILLIANDPARVVPAGVDIVGDDIPGAAALGGVYTALGRARTPWLLIVACDMPFITPAFLAHLCAIAESSDADVVLPRTDRGVQPLCAAYSRRVLDQVRRHIEARSLRLRDLLDRVRVRDVGPVELAPFDKSNRLFFNINSAEDYRRAVLLAEVQQ